MKFFKGIIIVCSFLLLSAVKSQVNLDSLWMVWNDTSQADTSKLKAIHKIAWDGYLFSNPDSAFYFAQMHYDFAIKVGDKKNMAKALKTQGVSFHIKGNYDKALEYYEKSLKISEEIGDKKGMSSSYNNIGNIYKGQGNYEKALEYHENSLKIKEEKDDKKGMGTSYNNIGNIYSNQRNFEKALEYHEKSFKIKEEIGDKKGMADSYNNIGTISSDQGNNEKALEYYEKSLKIFELIGDKQGIGDSYNNIGNIYKDQGNDEKALDYFEKCLKILEEIGDKKGIGLSYLNIGVIYQKQGNDEKSLKYLLMSKKIWEEINLITFLNETAKVLTVVYEKLDKPQKALENYKLHVKFKDSLAKMDGIEKERQRQFNEQYLLDKQADSIKYANEITIQKAETKAKEEEIKTQRIIEGVLIVGILLVIGFLVFVYKQLNTTKAQKLVIEEKQQEITDSINYAKRIQDAMMTSSGYIKDVLPESFIYFNPKDVVSGDFYWAFANQSDHVFFTVADCTGHGVPGAFMSMIGTSLLNKIIIENKIKETDQILNELRLQIIKALNQREDGSQKDGMDISLCRLDMKNKTLQFSGAMNPLIHVCGDELNIHKGDPQPIGYLSGKETSFTSHSVKIKKGDMVYIFSDGFQDQFGGEKGKKYRSLKFRNLLQSISDKSTDEQKELIEQEFTSWLGDYEQIDDVCVMGVKVT